MERYYIPNSPKATDLKLLKHLEKESCNVPGWLTLLITDYRMLCFLGMPSSSGVKPPEAVTLFTSDGRHRQNLPQRRPLSLWVYKHEANWQETHLSSGGKPAISNTVFSEFPIKVNVNLCLG